MWDEFDTLIMNINSLDIDDIKFETAIECLGLQPDDIDGYEKMERTSRNSGREMRKIRRKAKRTTDNRNKKFL